MRVNISVHGRWHAFELANGLHRRGALGLLATSYPGFAARQFLDPGIELRTRPLLEARRRLYDRWQIGAKPDLVIARSFARWAAANVVEGADILVGWSSATLEAIAPAQRQGLKVVLERGSTHIANQMRVLHDAYAEFGLTYRGTDDEIIARELAEYEATDAIAVPTEYAADTFVAEGIAREKIIINPYGVDLARFAAPTRGPRAPDARLRVLFVGRVGIQKGVPWLIEAAAKLGPRIEFHLVGPLDDESVRFVKSRSANVVVRGALPGGALPAEYEAADIFCLPSLQEGGVPLTLLQAMASGLPSIVTPPAQGPLLDGRDGLVVAVRSADALAGAVGRLAAAPDERRAMGEAARKVVETGYGWQDYADRALAHYRRLID